MEELNREALEKALLDIISQYAKALASFRKAEAEIKDVNDNLNVLKNDEKRTEGSVS